MEMEEPKGSTTQHFESPRRGSTSSDLLTEKTIHAHSAALAAALEDRPSPWSKGYLRLYAICLLIYLCSTMTGYDGSLMGSINAMQAYIDYYHLPPKGNSGTGIVFAIFQVGQMAAAPFVWLSDWKGRRVAIFLGCLGVCVGTVITATSPTLGGFIAGRFVLSFFSTIAATAAPLYLIEIAPPQYRGTMAGMYNTLYYFGSILATVTVYASNLHLTNKGNIAWRLALWLQMWMQKTENMPAKLTDPRLIGKDRVDEARIVVARLHTNGDTNHRLVHLQIDEMTESVRVEGLLTFRKMFDLRVLFKSRARRYRLALNVAFSWFGQFSGNNIASYYLPYLVANVGITSVNTQLLLNIIYAIGGWIPAMIGARLHDVVGRRKMLMGAALGMAVCLFITAGTAAGYVNTGSKASSSASIAFIYVFGSVFALAYTSMQPIYPGEVMSNDMRAKGMGVLQLVGGCAGFVNTFAAPIKYWFYVFFAFFDIFEFIIIYFFFVETKGRTLEELDEIFEAKNPRKASTMKTTLRQRVTREEGGNKRVSVDVV
ncbi:hypothetical protein H2200_004303 [Cladophialophora chaetospira]|uniref:Major facilitator superfamily (MFS) profile domain-containing protein n=1 Tax=Cladophialophora chaetospira TaxID=386627 RepID=A0AA39CK20_9EURO|nr:hypothetical protein H2200_004303 [Cladophialophora chaetospira]